MQPRAGVSSASPYFVVRNAPKTNKPQASKPEVRCRRGDLNPHALTGTGTLSQRVCQFRHSDVATRETRTRSRSVARRRGCATPESRQRQRPCDEALEDQAVRDRGETEHQRSKHGDAIEIALNHRRAGGCRACAQGVGPFRQSPLDECVGCLGRGAAKSCPP